MSSPSVIMTEIDGALGIQPPSDGLLALIGDASSGAYNTPRVFAKIKDVVTTHASGRLVEAAAYAIEHYGKPVILVRSTQATVAANTAIDVTGVLGTSVATIHAAAVGDDDYEVYLKVVTGGTIGVAGITLQWSLSDGRELSAVTALGTALFFAFPNSGSLRVDFAAGTLLAGDIVRWRATGPTWDGTALGVSLDALAATKQPWNFVHIVGPATGANVDTATAKLQTMHTAGKHKFGIMSFRVPTLAESDAAYQTAFDTAMTTHKTIEVDVEAGACKLLSSISYRTYKRSIAFAVAPLYAAVSEEQDVSQIAYGPLPGVQIRDSNGNLDEHDEFEQPGLDTLGATVLRTWDNRDGVWVNNPRIFCPVGSDFQYVQFRRVMNLARTTLKAFLETRLSRPILVNRKTGYILESEAVDIESGANKALEDALLAKPKASAAEFVLSRTDNLLSTSTLTYQERIVPLGYPKTITGDIAFNNPALRVIKS